MKNLIKRMCNNFWSKIITHSESKEEVKYWYINEDFIPLEKNEFWIPIED